MNDCEYTGNSGYCHIKNDWCTYCKDEQETCPDYKEKL